MRVTSAACVFLAFFSLTQFRANSLPNSSAKAQVAATSVAPTDSLLNLSGTSNPYELSCFVTGARISGVAGPAGTVTFNDLTTKQVLGSATLGAPFFSLLPKVIGGPSTGLLSVATGDFNGDGALDMAVTSPDSLRGNVSVLIYLGNGDGTFRTPVSSPTGSAYGEIVVADFNGDGKLDLAIGNPQPPDNEYPLTDGITILLGNGDGTFQAPKSYGPYGLFSSGFVAGDFNGDGKQDIAFVIPEAPGSTVYTLKILFGTASGVFKAPVSSVLGELPMSLHTGDFNRDGKQDLLVASKSGGLSLLLSNGDGTFQMSTVGSYTNATVGDFNGDGKLDIATLRGYKGISILLGEGNGTFQLQGTTYPVPAGGAYMVAATDFNGDGHADLMVADYDSPYTWGVFLGNGDGTFQVVTVFPFYVSFSQGLIAVAGDFQGGGFSDLVTLNAGGPEIFQNGKGASATMSTVVPPGTATSHMLDCSYAGNASYASSSSNNRAVTFQQTPPPVLSLAVGSYTAAQALSMTDSNSQAVITYTTDGSTPTVNSVRYSAPITVSTTETVKAVANVVGIMAQSTTSEAAYTIDNQLPAPVFSPAAGTYSNTQMVSLSDAVSGAKIYYTTNGSAPTTASALYSSPISVSATETLQAVATATGYNPSVVASAAYTIIRPAAIPTFSVATGIYGTEQLLSLEDATPGASIYYTIDGTAPTESSAKYSAPIVVASVETVKAVAAAPGFGPSQATSASYVVAGAPSALTAQASAVGSSGATVNATINPLGVSATYSFEFGTTKTTLTGGTPQMNLAATSTGVNVSAVLTGLASKTIYYYRVVVTTVGGSSTSALLSFTTN